MRKHGEYTAFPWHNENPPIILPWQAAGFGLTGIGFWLFLNRTGRVCCWQVVPKDWLYELRFEQKMPKTRNYRHLTRVFPPRQTKLLRL
jgi:hypothetical protein